jgi:NADH-quinone oxidoreductase subunit N
MSAVDYGLLVRLAMPEIVVVVTALAVMAADLMLRGRAPQVRWAVAAGLASLGCAAAAVQIAMGSAAGGPAAGVVMDGMLVASPLTHAVQLALLGFAVLTLLLAVDSTFTEHVGEFVLLVLVATVGMMFLVATEDLLVLFISLELLSLSLYVLTGFDKRSARSAEASLKYFLFGGMSAAFLLFGFSLLYGLGHGTSFASVAAAIHAQGDHGLDPLLAIAMVTSVVGLGFKVAAAPFHFWAPDVYQGAPAPSVGFIASASKVASFVVFFQLMALGFAGAGGTLQLGSAVRGWAPSLAVVAAFSMVLGNLVALRQSSLRRLLAYSAVAHAGYMLLGIVAGTRVSLAALLYYVITYGLATLGAFGVVAVVEGETGSDALAALDGLGRRAPVLSFCLAIFVLSLAGIPPLAGFFGKFYLFAAVLGAAPGLTPRAGAVWLVVLAIAMSAVSLYYYLKVLKRVYVAGPAEGAGQMRAPVFVTAVIALIAAAVVALGCAPQVLLQGLLVAVRASWM